MNKNINLEKKLFQKFFNTCPVSFTITNLKDGTYVVVNKAFTDSLGYSEKEVIGKSSIELNIWADPKDRNKIIEIIKKNGVVENYEAKFITKNGDYRIGLLSAVIVTIEDEAYLLVIAKDITQLKKIQNELKEKEEFLEAIFNNTKEGILIAEIDSKKFIYANPAICEMLGYSEDELLKLRVYDIHPKEKLNYIISEFEAQARGEKVLASEIPCLRKDGEIIYVDICTSKVNLKGIDCNIGMFTDVTERKEIRDSLKEREAHLDIILNSIGDAVIAVDKEGKITHMNPVAERLTDWTLNNAKGKKLDEIFKIVNERTRKPAEDPVKKVFSQGKIVGLANDTLLISKNGKEYNIADSAAPLKDKNGNIIGVVLVFRDITEKYRKQKELQETKDFLQAVFNSIQEGISVLDERLTIKYVNPIMERWYASNMPLIGKKCYEAYHNKNTHCESCPTLRCIETGKTEMNIVPGLPDDSSPVKWLELYSYPIKDSETGKVKGVVEFVRDVTDRILAENERLKLSKLESLGVLAGGIAHDFNNILTGIFGNINIAKIKLSKEHPAYEYLERANTALEKATGLTKQLLTFAKGGEPILEEVDIRSLIVDIVKFNLSGSNIKPHFNFSKDLLPVVGDKTQLSQVLSNLIINAKQAMPLGGNIFIEVRKVESLNLPDKNIKKTFIEIKIKDEGTGIPEKYIDKIFDPFFTTKQSGSGLGLSIVYSIIKKHGGFILVDSQFDSGATFTIYLPAKIKTKSKKKNKKEYNNKNFSKKVKILVMDDEELVRQVAGDMLKILGFQVEFAKNGDEAVYKFKKAFDTKNPFDVIILDLTIPGEEGGKKIVKDILKINPDAKVIVSSGYSEDPVMAKYEKYGFKGKILKPFKIEELEKEILRVLIS